MLMNQLTNAARYGRIWHDNVCEIRTTVGYALNSWDCYLRERRTANTNIVLGSVDDVGWVLQYNHSQATATQKLIRLCLREDSQRMRTRINTVLAVIGSEHIEKLVRLKGVTHAQYRNGKRVELVPGVIYKINSEAL